MQGFNESLQSHYMYIGMVKPYMDIGMVKPYMYIRMVKPYMYIGMVKPKLQPIYNYLENSTLNDTYSIPDRLFAII